MAWPSFFNGAAITSPEQAERQRAIAQSLIGRSATPGSNWADGLADVAAALSGTFLENRVSEAEAAGRERAGGLFANLALTSSPDAIAAALMSPDAVWATDAQTDIASALLNQGLERSDPAYQLDLAYKQAQLDQLQNPAPENPYLNVGGGSIFNTGTGEFMTAPGVAGADLPADVEEYNWYAQQEAAAGRQPMSYLEFQSALKGNGFTVTTPDGTVVQQGGAGKPLTEGQSKDVLYATRATNAIPTLDTYETALLSLGENLAGNAGVFKNYMQSEEYQLARDAGKEFLASILRKDTGAAVTPSEEQLYGEVFLPQPGNPPAVIAAKRQRRALAVEAIKAGMPAQAILNMNAALGAVPNTVAAPAGGAPATAAPDGVIDWSDL